MNGKYKIACTITGIIYFLGILFFGEYYFSKGIYVVIATLSTGIGLIVTPYIIVFINNYPLLRAAWTVLLLVGSANILVIILNGFSVAGGVDIFGIVLQTCIFLLMLKLIKIVLLIR